MNKFKTPIRRKRLPWLLAAALGLAAAPAFALDPPHDATIVADSGATQLNQAWRIANTATVEVHNVRGSVVVSAGEPGQATLSGELGSGSKLVIAGSEQHLEVRIDSDKDGSWFGNHGPHSDSDLVLKIPAGASLRVALVSADGRVTGIDGKSVNVESVSGRVTVTSGSPEISIENVSGDIALSASHAEADKRIHAQTVSGDIEVDGASGRVKLDTVSGRARATGSEVQEFEAGSVSGDVDLNAAIGKHGRMQISTMSGNVHATVPATLSAHIEAETFSGRIRSDFGSVKKPQYGPGSSLDATVGDGDVQIKTKSFSGNVDIVKRP
jgi:hypothetical protein